MDFWTLALRRRLPIVIWLAFFFGIQLTHLHDYSPNPIARISSTFALTEGQLNIDRYAGKTHDWSFPPDHHYYSNKPPGPSLLAVPFYFPVDLWLTRGVATREARDKVRFDHVRMTQAWLSFALQMVPFAVVMIIALGRLEAAGASARAVDLACVCALLGNTAAIYMNTYFGHGLTAWVVIAVFLALDANAAVWAGFFFGLAILCDYTMVILAPACAWMFWERVRDRPVAAAARVAIGGLGPLIVFMTYHAACFGGPFVLANKFVAPEFIDAAASKNLGGIFYPVPNLSVLRQLLFGYRQGILWTQPWVLLAVFVAPAWAGRNGVFEQKLARFGVPTIVVHLLLISAFNGWHGGWTAGPRYLCPTFPLLALLLASTYDRMPLALRVATVVSAFAGATFAIVAIVVDIIPPLRYVRGSPVWPYYLSQIKDMDSAGQLALLAWMGALVFVWIARPDAKKTERN